jgi:phage gpG-like protein
MIAIEFRDQDVISAFNRLLEATRNPSPALKAIGEALALQAKRTFASGTDPWGRRWQPNAPSTIAAMLARRSGHFASYSDLATRKTKQARVGTKRGYFRKDGELGARGSALVASKRPLIGAGRQLSTRIFYNVQGNVLTIGSPMAYAAMQQFGGKKSRFPHLWGDIPARPFLPVTASGELAPAARDEAVGIIREFLLGK